jgi:hypothetical protein
MRSEAHDNVRGLRLGGQDVHFVQRMRGTWTRRRPVQNRRVHRRVHVGSRLQSRFLLLRLLQLNSVTPNAGREAMPTSPAKTKRTSSGGKRSRGAFAIASRCAIHSPLAPQRLPGHLSEHSPSTEGPQTCVGSPSRRVRRSTTSALAAALRPTAGTQTYTTGTACSNCAPTPASSRANA